MSAATADFDYPLPSEAIAQEPRPRGTSRLLVVDARGEDRHRTVAELPQLTRPGDLLVVNDTRVLPARLFARRRPGGGRVELLLVERRDSGEWEALVRPGRKGRPGTELELPDGPAVSIVGEIPGGRRLLRFSADVEPHLERLGHMPLPPYVRRPDTAADRHRYQTVYARHPGAVAAPTAGLHFTDELLRRLRDGGVRIAPVTLHVGPGTFRPVTAERVEDHPMEAERYTIPSATAAAVAATRRAGGRVLAVGTTVVRTLEGACRAAGGPAPGTLVAGSGRTDLFIVPGYRFRVVDGLLTNFHLPRSTLLMLVAAFAGRQRVLAAYREALHHGYRFYSYGDAMWLEKREPERSGSG